MKILQCTDNMTDDTRASPEIIAMLREPGAAERFLLGLLGPDDTRITQSYDDGVLRQNLAYHALANTCFGFTEPTRIPRGSTRRFKTRHSDKPTPIQPLSVAQIDSSPTWNPDSTTAPLIADHVLS
ncbi:hypothetical protein C1H46_038255 [Malus baccata]|uniref:Uncharacterized protein n=1 Tax=Malus baccata TaxID=106549 RepID=A0A540KPS9_MALBA|nr:hypothetical protein C1H46_038255 [Malus baccata]